MSLPDFQHLFPKEEVERALVDFLRDRRLLHPWMNLTDFNRVQMIPGNDGSIFLNLWRQ